MNYLSHLYLPGALAMWAAMFFALAAAWGYADVVRGNDASRDFARRAYRYFALSVVFAAIVLLVCLARRDYRIEYVHQYTGSDLRWYYQLAAFWAGQKGSFLIWLLWGSLLGLPLYRSAGKKHEAPVMGIYLLTLIGLLFILVRENPFVMLDHAPADGEGLNPLLQDNWMVIHPPIMFIGYAASAIPFAFAMSALWRRQRDDWAARAFPWALGGFLVLGTAILLGGYWAYKTLGWGGYWGWDPVENASLVPWLFGTVLIHGLHMERAKGRYRRINYVLAAMVYLSVLYGTFLTRSGVLADFSVHSFVDLGISGWLIALMAFFVGLTALLLATRLRDVPTEKNEDPLLSRGTFMVLSTITVAVCGTIVLIGTSAPLLTRFMTNPGQVGPEFYNRVNLPIALLVAFLLALVPYLTWRGEQPAALLRRLLWPGVAAFAVAVTAAIAWSVRQPMHVAFVFLATLALSTNLVKTIAKFRNGGLAGAGGYLAHVGVGVILLGILASSAYDHGEKVTLTFQKPQQVDDLTMTFSGYLARTETEREGMEIRVENAKGDVYYAYPRLFMNDRTRQLMVHPHIHKLALMDLYVSPIEFDPGEPGGADRTVELRKGASATVGDTVVDFQGFDMNADGNAMTQMQAGGAVTIGAVLRVRRGGREESAMPLYRFHPDGSVESPPLSLQAGGAVLLTGINASDGAVRLQLAGLGGAGEAGTPARLSVDVTRKPLIRLVWYGLYLVLAGGLAAAANRLRQVRVLERVAGERD
jgi:cytochrome c-type biogenesis protein CcmF